MMHIRSSTRGDTATVSLRGELDHHSALSARRELDLLLRDPAIRNLNLELSELEFMDSSGIGLILARYRKVRDRGGRMRLLSPRPAVDQVLALSGVYQLMEKEGSYGQD